MLTRSVLPRETRFDNIVLDILIPLNPQNTVRSRAKALIKWSYLMRMEANAAETCFAIHNHNHNMDHLILCASLSL